MNNVATIRLAEVGRSCSFVFVFGCHSVYMVLPDLKAPRPDNTNSLPSGFR